MKLKLLALLTLLAGMLFAQPEVFATGSLQDTSRAEIAFIRDGNLWIISPDGSDARQLSTRGGYSEPAWSPTEDKIAFVHQYIDDQSKDAWEIGVINLDTSQEEIVIPAEKTPMGLLGNYFQYSNPRWAPHGDALYYIASDGRAQGDFLHKYDLSARGQAGDFGEFFGRGFDVSKVDGEIAFTGFSNAVPAGYDLNLAAPDGSQHRVIVPLENMVYIDAPRWSPDGNQIAFAGRGGAYGAEAIVVISPPNTHPSIFPASVDSRWSAGLSWSPSGEKIVYASDGMLRILDLTTGGSEALTVGADPSWKSNTTTAGSTASGNNIDQASPGTSTCAYIISGEIWLVDSQTDQRSAITAGTNYNYLDWSPDGFRLLAISDDQRVDFVNVLTGNINPIGRVSKGRLVKPSWSPDGQKVFFQDFTNDTFQTRVVDTSGKSLLAVDNPLMCPIWAQNGEILYYFDGYGQDQSFWQHDFTDQTTTLVFSYGKTHDFGLSIEACYVSKSSPWFTVWNYWSEGTGQVIILNTLGDERIIFTPESDDSGGDPLGDWSPDGKQFVFQSGNTFWASMAPIYYYDVETQETTTLWQEGGLNPRWSPDGKMIAFTTWKGGLNLIEVASQQLQTLLSDAPENMLHEYLGWGGQQIGYFATEEMEPSWSPNGSQIILTYPEGFYILDVATGDQQWIDQGIAPKWQPIPLKVEPTATPTAVPPTSTNIPTITATPIPTDTQIPDPAMLLTDSEISEESPNRFSGMGFIILITLVVGGAISIFVVIQRRKRKQSGIKPAYPEPAPVPPAQSATAQLVGIQGVPQGQTTAVFDGFLIGRSSDCDLQLPDPSVSRIHAKLRFALNTWYLQDQGSQSGTLLNGERIDSTIIKDGDRIRINDFEFRFQTG